MQYWGPVSMIIDTRSAGNLTPIAIGMTVVLNIMMAGSLTGANFNPAISLGPMIATANFTNAWLYVIAPIVGALGATLIHKAMKLLAEDGTEVAARSAAPAE
jgi:glycerol uptake facilitator-like aquaporin